MLTRRTAVLAALETTYGTDPAMTAAANGFLVWDVDVDINGEVLNRDILRDTLSPIPHVIGMKDVTLKFKTELKGVVGASSSTGPETNLLSGCSFGTAAVSGTAWIYTPVSAEVDMRSISFWLYKDGNKHKITGARGNPKWTLEAGKYGVIEWTFQGLYNAVSADTVPTGIPGGLLPPICYSAGFQIGGFAPVCSKAEIDLGTNLVRNEDINAASGVQSFRITGRKGTLNFNADAVIESSNPFWGDWVGDITDTYAMTIGSTAGNKVVLSGYFKYDKNKYADSNGVSKYECNASLVTSDASQSNTEIIVKIA